MFDCFWNEWFWLPQGYGWDDVAARDGLNTPSARDLFIWPPIIAVVLLFIRKYIVSALIFKPLGEYYGVRSKPYRAPKPNGKLDELYAVNRARPPSFLLDQYAIEVGMTTRQVERWLRQKALSQQMTTLEKFIDHGWQLTYYSIYCVAGIIIVTSKPWYTDVMKVFENYPLQSVPNDIWWYYMIAIGYYLVQSTLLFIHDKNHDFYLMLAHHIFAMGILTFCWVTNIVRLCSLSLLFHECADICLSLGKLCTYTSYRYFCNILIIPFLFIWISTRLYLYPMYVMRTSFYLASLTGGTLWPAAYILQVFMTGLFILHVMWTIAIIRFVKKALLKKEIRDARSSPEELSDDDNDDECQQNNNHQDLISQDAHGAQNNADNGINNTENDTVVHYRSLNGIRSLSTKCVENVQSNGRPRKATDDAKS